MTKQRNVPGETDWRTSGSKSARSVNAARNEKLLECQGPSTHHELFDSLDSFVGSIVAFFACFNHHHHTIIANNNIWLLI